jgi:hypothetical protein
MPSGVSIQLCSHQYEDEALSAGFFHQSNISHLICKNEKRRLCGANILTASPTLTCPVCQKSILLFAALQTAVLSVTTNGAAHFLHFH